MTTPRLLITGGAGFIGTAITTAALDAGWRVRILDSLRPDVHAPGWTSNQNIEFYRVDVTEPNDVTRALKDVDAVSHQAAKVGLGVNYDDTQDYVHTNDTGTAVLLTAMHHAGITHLALASSMVVYGEGAYVDDDGHPVRVPPRHRDDLDRGIFDPVDPRTGHPLHPADITEAAPLDPRNVYAATKAQQEYLTTAWARATGGKAAILRYHNVYGPNMPQNTPYAGVASLFRSQIARGEAPTVYEDGGQRRDFVHVRDIAAANLAALTWLQRQPAETTRTYNVGSGTPHTIGDMAVALAHHTGGKTPITTGAYRLGDVRHITASSQRLHTELNVPTPTDFQQGIKEFATAPLRAAVN